MWPVNETASSKASIQLQLLHSKVGSFARQFRSEIVGSVIFLAIGIAVISLQLPLSPIDEQAHIDYTLKAGQLRIPGDNELLGQEAMRIMSCTGIDSDFNEYLPSCSQDSFDPSAFPDQGFSESADSTPTFYLTTGLLARSIRMFSPIDDLLFSLRLANWIWIAGAGVLVIRILRQRNVPKIFSVSVATLMIANPVALTAGVNVNPDSQLPLAGLLLFQISSSQIQGKKRLPALFVSSVLLLSIDRAMALPLIACLLILVSELIRLLITNWRNKVTDFNSRLFRTSTAVVSLIAATLLGPRIINQLRLWYSGSEGGRTIDLPRDSWFSRPPFTWELIFNQWTTSFPPIRGGYIIPPLRQFDFSLLVDVTAITVAGGILAYFFSAQLSRDQTQGMIFFFTGLFGLPIMTLLLWIKGGSFWTLSPRFLLGILALLFLLVGLAGQSRASRVWVILLSATTTLSLVFHVFSF